MKTAEETGVRIKLSKKSTQKVLKFILKYDKQLKRKGKNAGN